MNGPGFDSIAKPRAVIDRRTVAARLAVVEDADAAVAVLRAALDAGREEVAARFARDPSDGRSVAGATAFLHDQIVRLAFDFVTRDVADTSGDTFALVGLGGTGRGEMAPFSDVDLMFLTPGAPTDTQGIAAEAVLHLLWALKLKVGHSIRSIDQLIDLAKSDMTVRTAFLESRWIWGDSAPFDAAMARYRKEVVTGTAAEFVAAKLAERDARHVRMGDSRYVVEPNVKDGKGGLRDLHTLYWIGKYVHGVAHPSELVGAGLLSAAEYRKFDRAERFLWAVRCHLHMLAGRAEERLGFEHQRQIAALMNYADRPGKNAVERFMRFYFLNARAVGDLTGLFLAQLDEQLGKSGFRFALPTIRRRPKRLAGLVLDRGRLSIPSDNYFKSDPVRLIELFALAAREQLEIHPSAMRAAARDAALIDRAVRDDPRANQLFLEVLTCINKPELVLRWMNEAGVFGRFVPDFARVVAQMQFDMYHHYTVDEHSIRAIGLLAAIERGDLKQDHPLSTAILKQIGSRRLLYVAVLLHDIAKGRGGDHSVLGAEIALKLCPRLGLDAAETETVAWLVRYHLLLSATAFKRDLADPKTIEDFVHQVQSPERLRLLLVLTVVDIRAVGPGVWNDWKRTLLRTLFEAAEERLRLGHKQHGRAEMVARRQAELADALGWKASAIRAHARRLPDSYWLAEPLPWQTANARQVAAAEARIGEAKPSVVVEDDPDSGATRVSVFTSDREGLFYRICAGLAAAGANIIDARIHTTRDGLALDNLLVLDGRGQAYSDRRLRTRLVKAVEAALAGGDAPPLPVTQARGGRDAAFRVAPSVTIADRASTRTTVVEVNARDRPALLAGLARAIHQQGHRIHSAHIATYGERAVDVFYLSRADGKKLDESDMARLREGLLAAASEGAEAKAA
ncbi:[protein-PII] uridylyltransferase [Sphingomonas lutea]|uniref:[protein-PII] uridylyltransferase n=1 Tax=Sphingomonas lutea TaxID=1045317 RepID=UPI001F328391|nr:[protein-PII] uridylyltransferase [Sphingomonas lutea]